MPYASNQGIRIHYDVEGKGSPLVMVPSIGRCIEYFSDSGLTQVMRQDHQLILIDMRGHGASDKPHDPKAYAWKFLIEDIVCVLNVLKIQKAHYFGGDWGGRVGFHIPLYAKDRFYSLTLRSATYPIRGCPDVSMDRYIELYNDLIKLLGIPANKIMDHFQDYKKSVLGTVDTPAMRMRFLLNDPEAIMAILWSLQEEKVPDAKELLPKLTIPCLILVGANDPRCPIAQENSRLIQKATFIALPGFDFFQTSRRVESLATIIKKFLNEVDRKNAVEKTQEKVNGMRRRT